jgi:DNA replication protein DnaC
MVNKKCYLSTAYTSSGFVDYNDYLINPSERVYLLIGAPGTGKSTFMKKTGIELQDYGFSVEFIYSSEYKDKIDAVYVSEANILIINGSKPNSIEAKYPGAIERILDFGNYCDIDYLRNEKNSIVYLFDEISREYSIFFEYMKNAKLIHDKWEKEYLLGMNFTKANEITNNIINEYVIGKKDKKSKVVHRFSGTLASNGQICFYENLTQDIKNRIVVKGRPGTGKSTMNKKIAKAAIEAGYDVEYYHCGFDAESIDMIIIPELSFAILDGTAPHVVDPIGNDKLVDMYECIDKEIVNENENPIKSIGEAYSEEITKAKDTFYKIGKLNSELENYYREATDFNEVDALRNRIVLTIRELKR